MAERTWDQTAADRLADEVAALVRRKVIDSRSPAADALLDYRDPPSTPRADRLAALEAECARLRAVAAGVGRQYEGRVQEVTELRAECARLREVLALWRTMRATPPTDEHGSTARWCEAYTNAERALDAAAALRGPEARGEAEREKCQHPKRARINNVCTDCMSEVTP